ncbi:MAG TPA: tripartite tricarboxylate transporter TctB family protein [Burkholderiales bacterium]
MSAPEPGPPRGRYKARAAFGLAVALLGGSYMWASVNISSGPGYTAVGPGAFPLAIGAGLVLSGLAVAIADLLGRTEGVPTEPIDWATLLAMIGLLAAYVAVYEVLGFIVATMVMYALSARALGSRRWGVNILVAVLLTVVVYGVFHYLLQVQLPAGRLWTH